MSEAFSTAFGWHVPAPKPAHIYAPTMRSILATVSAEHGLRPEDLTGDARASHIARARQDFMWRVRQVKCPNGSCRYSTPQIGRFLGGRDHTTVLHGVKAHLKRMGRAA